MSEIFYPRGKVRGVIPEEVLISFSLLYYLKQKNNVLRDSVFPPPLSLFVKSFYFSPLSPPSYSLSSALSFSFFSFFLASRILCFMSSIKGRLKCLLNELCSLSLPPSPSLSRYLSPSSFIHSLSFFIPLLNFYLVLNSNPSDVVWYYSHTRE